MSLFSAAVPAHIPYNHGMEQGRTHSARWLKAFAMGSIAAAILALVDPIWQVGQPFAGFFVGPHGIVGFRDRVGWTGPTAAIRPADRVLALEGQPVPDNSVLFATVSKRPAGTPFHYRMLDGRLVTVNSMTFSWNDYIWAFGLPSLGGLIHLLLGYIVRVARPNSQAARAHWHYCLGIAAFFLLSGFGFRHPWALIGSYLAASLVVVPILNLATTFPSDLPRWRRPLQWLGGMVTFGSMIGLGYGLADARVMPMAFQYLPLAPIGAMGVLFISWSWQAVSSKIPPNTRAQARVVGMGMGLSIAPPAVYTVLQIAGAPLPPVDLTPVTLSAFPASMAFAILRYGLLDVPDLTRRLARYSALVISLGVVYALAAAGIGSLFGQLAGQAGAPGMAGFVAALAVTASFRPLHDRLRQGIDHLFIGRRVAPFDALATLGERAASGAPGLARALVETIQSVLGAQSVALETAAGLNVLVGLPDLEPHLTWPLTAGNVMLGRLHIGPRLDLRAYTDEERALLRTLATQASLGLQQAQMAEAQLQSRLREMLAEARASERTALLQQLLHDMGTDLSTIAVAVELACEEPASPLPWQTIRRSLRRIEAFLAEKRGSLLGYEPLRRTSAKSVLIDAIDALEPTRAANDTRIEWQWRAPRDRVGLSEIELGQAVLNVLANALSFSPRGGLIQVQATEARGCLVLEVCDEGPGVPADLLPTPGDGRRGHHHRPGSGLGLANVRRLLESIGGHLAWRNGERGAIVSLHLPLLP